MTNYFVSRKYFYAIYAIILIVLILMFISFSRERLFLAINGNYNLFFDYFFYLVTELGNTWTFVIVIVISLFYSRRFTLMLLAGLLISSLLAQGLKHFVFDDVSRPLGYFKGSQSVHHLTISEYLMRNSFPSGHSVTIFTLVTIIVAFTVNRKYDLLLLFIAFLVAYSRVYLGQHFVEDVVFGGLIGVFSGTVSVFIFRNVTKYNKPLINSRFMSKK